jgi:hypothetical protein
MTTQYIILVLDLRKYNRQNIGDHNRMFNEMNHWLNTFYHYEFLIMLDHDPSA